MLMREGTSVTDRLDVGTSAPQVESPELRLPADATLGLRPGQLSCTDVLEACRTQLLHVDAGERREWRVCRTLEALYHPGRYLRAAFVLLDDPAIPAFRTWPEGQLVYVNLPVRPPISRRGELIEIGGLQVEAYAFPNDRRLRGIRHFAGKDAAVACWQGWLSGRGETFRIDPESLQRLLVRYVPEQKWIVRLRAEGADATGTTTTRRLAVRAADADECARLAFRHRRFASMARASAAPFVVPEVVGLHESGELLGVEWIRGDTLVERLRNGDAASTMTRVANVLAAFQRFPTEGIEPLAYDGLAVRARAATDDLAAAAPEMRESLEALRAEMDRRLADFTPVTAACLHNDFHWNQFRIKDDRFALLDLERARAGDPLIDVANFATQLGLLGSRPEIGVSVELAESWRTAFLAAWESGSAAAIDGLRYRVLGALSALELARGMMRHLRAGWPELAGRCIAEARRLLDDGGNVPRQTIDRTRNRANWSHEWPHSGGR